MADRFVFCPAAASGCRLSLPVAKGARGACEPWLMPALLGLGGSKWHRALPGSRTLSNAVPWVRSEKDTFLSGQLLVVNGRRGGFN